MAKNSDNLIYFTLRLNLDNPQHMKVGKVLKNLNPKKYKSVNKYMIDVIEYYKRLVVNNLKKVKTSRTIKGILN